MEFKEKLLSSHLAFEEDLNLNDSVHKTRASALKIFEDKGFPSKKEEAWKYTSLEALIQKDYSLFPKSDNSIEVNNVKKYFLYDTDTYKVIFIDGVYSPFLSNTTHDGLDVCLMSAALSKPKYRKLINTYFNKIAPNKAEPGIKYLWLEPINKRTKCGVTKPIKPIIPQNATEIPTIIDDIKIIFFLRYSTSRPK